MMYELVAKDGEVVTKRHASSMDNAIEIFGKIKNLPIDELLKIYTVRCVG